MSGERASFSLHPQIPPSEPPSHPPLPRSLSLADVATVVNELPRAYIQYFLPTNSQELAANCRAMNIMVKRRKKRYPGKNDEEFGPLNDAAGTGIRHAPLSSRRGDVFRERGSTISSIVEPPPRKRSEREFNGARNLSESRYK